MTDKPDIERLLALAEAATEGPWRPGLASDPEWICDPEGFFIAMVSPDDDDPRPNCQTKEGIKANVAFIAAARTALPEVCTYALGLEARVKELEATARKVCNINADLEEFDGGRRGIAASFESAMGRLEALLAKHTDPETAA